MIMRQMTIKASSVFPLYFHLKLHKIPIMPTSGVSTKLECDKIRYSSMFVPLPETMLSKLETFLCIHRFEWTENTTIFSF